MLNLQKKSSTKSTPKWRSILKKEKTNSVVDFEIPFYLWKKIEKIAKQKHVSAESYAVFLLQNRFNQPTNFF